MLKVIVADDEKRICRLICMLADWNALGMEVVTTAANGLEALEAIQKHQPDILITDIHMPGCSGLELIEQAKQLQPELEIIIVSGYAYFDYAQSAIKHGVGEYLLKPIKQEELMASLRKLGQRCRERMNTVAEVHTLREGYQEQITRQQEQFVSDLMNKQVEDLSATAIEKHYHLRLDNKKILAFVLKLDYAPGTFTDASVDVILEKARYILNNLLSPFCDLLVVHFEKTEGCGILSIPDSHRSVLRNALREAVNQLTAQRPMFGAIAFSAGLGQEVLDTQKLPLTLKTARYAVLERLREGTGRLYESVNIPKTVDTDALLQRYRSSIGNAIDQLDLEAADQCAVQMETEALSIPGITGKALLDLVEAAGKMFILRWNFPQQEELVEQYELYCRQSSSAAALFDQLRKMQAQQIQRIQQERENEASRPIRAAKKYVQEHYRESITLEDVSAAVGFSSSYFSVLFKKENGEGFSKYLTGVRIDKAKELLQETNLTVAEVCSEVGYSDGKHFVQTFRKATGLNPAQYRKLYG